MPARWLSLVLVLVVACVAFSPTWGQDTARPVTLHYADSPVWLILSDISREFGITFSGQTQIPNRATVNVDEVSLEESLNAVLEPIGYAWRKTAAGYEITKDGGSAEQPAPATKVVEFHDGLVWLSAQQMDVRDLANQLSRATGANIILDPAVTGQVTLLLSGVTIEECLRALIHLLGPYDVVREGSLWVVQRAGASGQRPRVLVSQGMVDLSADDVEVREVLSSLAEAAGISLLAAEDVRGRVSLHLHQVAIEDAIDLVARAGGATVIRAAGAYLITRGGPGAFIQPRVEVTARGPEEARYRPLVTINALEGNLEEVIERVAKETGTQVIVLGRLQEPVTARISDVTVDEALRLLVGGTRFSVVKDADGRYLVADATPNSPFFLRAAKTEVFDLRYLDASDLPQMFSSAVSSSNFRVLQDRNAIAVTGDEDTIRRVRDEIAALDEPAPLVLIEAVMVETSQSVTEKLGAVTTWKDRKIALGVPGVGDITYSTIGELGSGFTSIITALIDQGKGKIIANPRIVTLSGRQAIINIGEQRYFKILTFPYIPPQGQAPVPIQQVQAITAGITLRITPTVGSHDDILLAVSPEVSSITGLTAEGLPEIAQRRADTTLQVKSGEIVVIGGLKQREHSQSRRKVPLLGDIPLLGELFTSRSRVERESELVIVIVCTVFRRGAGLL